MRTGKKFRMGDMVKIKVVAANLDKRQLDYEWVPDEGKGSVPRGVSKSKKSIQVAKNKPVVKKGLAKKK